MICVWDLRVESGGENPRPALVVSKSHDTGKIAPRRSKLTAPPARGVTSLLFSEHASHELISSGTFDGYVSLQVVETQLIRISSQNPAAVGSPIPRDQGTV